MISCYKPDLGELIGLATNEANGLMSTATYIQAPLLRTNKGYDMNDTSLFTGYYGINTDSLNILNNNSGINYGTLFVLNAYNLSGTPILQVAINDKGNVLKIRFKWHVNEFTPWRSISLT